MPATAAPIAADAILAVHVAVIVFNVFGLVAIPLGARRGWRFVRVAWWRLLHVAALGVVAAQALLGRTCFLTVWQSALTGQAGQPPPLVMRWVDAALFWPLPLWVFAALYVLVLAYALALLRLVPPSWPRH